MCEEYNSVLSTPTEADKISSFGRYRYIIETQISAQYVGLSLLLVPGVFLEKQAGYQAVFESFPCL